MRRSSIRSTSPQRPGRHIRRLAAALAALTACDATGPAPRDLSIVFHAASGDALRGTDIYLRSPDGQAVETLVERVGDDFAAAWSPDGRRIAFAGRSGPHVSRHALIFVVDRDGTALRPLTDETYHSNGPAWSPDGARIAFYRWIDPFTWGLAIMNADGSGLAQIPNTRSAAQAAPTWSPDGTRLAFGGGFGDTYAIWVVGVDGSGLTRLTSGDCVAMQPAWSPDGSRIAYSCGTSAGGGIHLMNAGGTGVRQLTSAMGDGEPAWTPAGDRVVFTRWRNASQFDPTTELYTVDVANGAIEPLGPTDVNERRASWRPTPP